MKVGIGVSMNLYTGNSWESIQGVEMDDYSYYLITPLEKAYLVVLGKGNFSF